MVIHRNPWWGGDDIITSQLQVLTEQIVGIAQRIVSESVAEVSVFHPKALPPSIFGIKPRLLSKVPFSTAT